MPVPLNGLVFNSTNSRNNLNFKSIDSSETEIASTVHMTSTTTSMSNLAGSQSANAAYVRRQGLNNSNSSTVAQRAKTFMNHFNSASVNNITATNAGSFSKLKSTFSKQSKENNSTNSSSISTQNLNDLTPPVNGSKKNNYPGSLKIDHSSKGLKVYNEPASPVSISTTSTIESIKQSLNLAANQHNTNNNRNFATLPLNKTSKLNSVSNGNLHFTSNLSGSSSTAISYNNNSNHSDHNHLHSSTLLLNKRKTLSISSSSASSSSTNLNNDDDTVTNQLASYSAYSYNKPPEPLKHFSKTNSNVSSNSSTKLTNAHSHNSTSSVVNSTSSSPSCTSPSSNKVQMPFKIRSSKYRHVYGNPHKEEVCYKNIKITKNAASDSSFCAVNPKFVAVVTEECGGGAFLVIPIKHTGRIEINMPKITGHRGPVLDLKWNPFNDNEIASCSEDTTIKVWQVPDTGLTENLNEWVVDLHGHQRKVNQIEWHPTAENIMISAGADFQVILWNLEKAEPIRIISCHNDTIHSMCWNRNGSLFATCCKDRKIRLIDPRTGAVVVKGDGHQGSKISRVVMLSCGTKLFTTGFSKLSERQIALWNINDLSKPIQMEFVDCSSGILIPYYDSDTNIVFVAGKGDGNVRYYEITDSEPYIHYLSEYKSSSPQRGLGFMPKRGLDVTKNEIFRFYKLHATGGICEPISMIVPRKSEVFQEDIYPDTPSGIPSLSCNEWLNGETKEPILMSMKDGAIPFMPKIVTYKQIGFSDLSNNNYSRSYVKSSKKSDNQSNSNGNSSENEASTKLFIENSSWKTSDTENKTSKSHGIEINNRKLNNNNNHFSKSSSSSSDSSSPAPSSSPNKYDDGLHHDEMLDSVDHHHLSLNKQNDELEGSYLTNVSRNPVTLRKTESLKLDSVQSIRNRFNRISSSNIGTLVRNRSNSITQNDSQINNSNMIESNANSENELPPPPTLVHSPSYGVNKPAVPTPLLATTINTENSTSNLLNGGCVKKRVWTPVQSTSSLKDANNLCTNNAELQKSYFRLLEEKNGLKEQLVIQEKRYKQLEEELIAKDKRITMLENRLNYLMVEPKKIELIDTTDC